MCAVAAADRNLGDDEIRVATGTYAEAVVVQPFVDEHVLLEGGWNATFDARTEDPALTIVDAENASRVLHVEPYVGSVTVRNLTFARGAAVTGAGVAVLGRSVGQATLEDCIVRDSEARGSGGGVDVFSTDNGQVRLEAIDVLDNVANGVTHAFGGGMTVVAFGAGAIVLDDIRVEGNRVDSPGSSSGAGIHLDQDPIGTGEGVTVQMRRIAVVGNEAQGSFLGGQVVLRVYGPAGGVLLGDSLVADALGARGLDADVQSGARLQLVNVTAAGNADTDLRVQGVARIANSLADTTTLSGGQQLQNNLFDADPGYVDRNAGDYRLILASPAVGAGTATPDGGLGPLDLDGNARIIGPRVDLGAYEADDPTLFVDGFED